ncbi:MAG: DUF3301 domain-containing protein [Gammaproteobacteria bacterium]|nr:DUF3301 domain-containing protein [Gammaproteobacteria bacterium]
MDILVALAIVGLVLWFWSDSLRCREVALMASERACREMGVQLLDQTVALSGMRLRRNEAGRLSLLRIFGFEFTVDGVSRLQARVIILGRRIDLVHMDFPDGATILDGRFRVVDAVQ